MKFIDGKAIYLQIVDLICEQIIRGDFESGDKIHSVREFAGTLGVNPNTIVRTYEKLQSLSILENRRGRGLFVTEKGQRAAMKYMKDNFVQLELPKLFRTMRLLDFDIQTLEEQFTHYLQAPLHHES